MASKERYCRIEQDWTDSPVHQCKLAVKNGSCVGKCVVGTHNEEGRSIPGSQRIRRISVLSLFNCRGERQTVLESPLFYQQCNVSDVEKSKLIGHRVTAAQFKVQSKVDAIVADVSDPMTPSHSGFSCFLFAVCIDYYVSWCVNPTFLE